MYLTVLRSAVSISIEYKSFTCNRWTSSATIGGLCSGSLRKSRKRERTLLNFEQIVLISSSWLDGGVFERRIKQETCLCLLGSDSRSWANHGLGWRAAKENDRDFLQRWPPTGPVVLQDLGADGRVSVAQLLRRPKTYPGTDLPRDANGSGSFRCSGSFPSHQECKPSAAEYFLHSVGLLKTEWRPKDTGQGQLLVLIAS